MNVIVNFNEKIKKMPMKKLLLNDVLLLLCSHVLLDYSTCGQKPGSCFLTDSHTFLAQLVCREQSMNCRKSTWQKFTHILQILLSLEDDASLVIWPCADVNWMHFWAEERAQLSFCICQSKMWRKFYIQKVWKVKVQYNCQLTVNRHTASVIVWQ